MISSYGRKQTPATHNSPSVEFFFLSKFYQKYNRAVSLRTKQRSTVESKDPVAQAIYGKQVYVSDVIGSAKNLFSE